MTLNDTKLNDTLLNNTNNTINSNNTINKTYTIKKPKKKKEWKSMQFKHQINEKGNNNLHFFISILFKQPRLEYALHHLAYENKGINLPERKTKFSAGYDFEAAEDVVIPSFKNGLKPTLIKTGIKAAE